PLVAFLLFEQDGVRAGRAEPDLVAFHPGDEPERDVVMMPRVRTLSAFYLRVRICLGQLDPLALDLVDDADARAVGADHHHVLADCACVSHASVSCWGR